MTVTHDQVWAACAAADHKIAPDVMKAALLAALEPNSSSLRKEVIAAVKVRKEFAILNGGPRNRIAGAIMHNGNPTVEFQGGHLRILCRIYHPYRMGSARWVKISSTDIMDRRAVA